MEDLKNIHAPLLPAITCQTIGMKLESFAISWEKGQSTHLLQSKALAEHWEKSRDSRHLHPKAWIRTQKEASTQ